MAIWASKDDYNSSLFYPLPETQAKPWIFHMMLSKPGSCNLLCWFLISSVTEASLLSCKLQKSQHYILTFIIFLQNHPAMEIDWEAFKNLLG
jgi:hypothetical protein